ncbi:hypothetical protein U1Q18_016679 [Sarracenia purpurea var. burkii]
MSFAGGGDSSSMLTDGLFGAFFLIKNLDTARLLVWEWRGQGMDVNKFDAKNLLKDKRFWFASVLISWAAALQGHMIWLRKQDSFKQKFGTIDESDQVSESPEKSPEMEAPGCHSQRLGFSFSCNGVCV